MDGATLDARIPTPCQGEGRGFESRRPLQEKVAGQGFERTQKGLPNPRTRARFSFPALEAVPDPTGWRTLFCL